MKDTPPQLRSLAPLPGIKCLSGLKLLPDVALTLLDRHAAVYRFGTDEFTGNILFAMFYFFSLDYISASNPFLKQKTV